MKKRENIILELDYIGLPEKIVRKVVGSYLNYYASEWKIERPYSRWDIVISDIVTDNEIDFKRIEKEIKTELKRLLKLKTDLETLEVSLFIAGDKNE